ncbi:scavenger receptor cysteine-rich type 1 protein M130-like isoform X1 [Xiphophorus maculatus]|uniref:scavenger receptor cysteine-rich type 1 protein M130-like isoform X1 n=1 Tax=Xiphophorus maculatus TaxID=8083 RepID=UPI000C6EFDB8|nr:scavenger receptor cysteine-rich type 1 protein M130-like isoform X1 [Xiphophorus maculatus]
MWFLLLLLHTFAHFGPVGSADPNQGKIILRSENNDNPCEGHVEVYYGNEMGHVGDKNWNEKTDEVVCRSTHCGRPVRKSNVYRAFNSTVWLNELECRGDEASLWDCDGWPGPKVSFYRKPTVKKITCSYDISFHLEQHKCEGAVMYTIQSPTENHTGYVCSDGFEEDDATRLCNSLPGCKGPGKKVTSQWMTTEKFMSSQHRALINCAGIQNVKHLWQCVESLSSTCAGPAAVSCEGHKRLQLRGKKSNVCAGKLEEEGDGKWKPTENQKTIPDLCKKLHCGNSQPSQQNATSDHVNCTDQVKVFLTDDGDKETKCYGYVKIQSDNKKRHVCGNDWTEKEYEMVCKELKCGKVIKMEMKTMNRKDGIMNHVKCTGGESSLWYCRAEHRHQQCTSAPYVVCQASLEVRLQDGPGKCAGLLEVKDEGQWKRVSKEGWDASYTQRACRLLDCGDAGKDKLDSDEFSQGTAAMLTFSCKEADKNLTDCKTTKTNNQNRNEKAVQLICNENKLLFLDGPQSCSGYVAIEYKENLYWLSGSNETWNKELANKVCQQMHCGNASSFSPRFSEDKNRMWGESFSCSSDHKSIFDCNKKQINSNNSAIAHVKCEGKITVTLENECWGAVKISTGDDSGYVSGRHWSDMLSEALCKELGCGTEILTPIIKSNTNGEIKFKGLFKMTNSSKMAQYSIVKMETNPESTRNPEPRDPAYVVCKDSVKPRFNDKDNERHKCSGNVEVSYEGQWFPVSKATLDNKATQKTICAQLECGDALDSKAYYGPRPKLSHVVTVQGCSQNTVAECKTVTAKTFESNSQTSDLGGLRCSNWRTLGLEDFGTLQPSSEDVCKGDVVVYSNGESDPKRNFVSSQNLTQDVGQKLCDAMKCGKYKRYRNSIELLQADNWYEGIFKCKSSTNIWDCETQKQQRDRNETAKLYIECEGKPEMKLSQTGELSIDGVPVCRSQWETDYSHMVCQQLGKGNAIPTLSKKQGKTLKDSYHIRCDKHNYLIGQCQRAKGNCNEGPVTIYCSRDVEFNTTETCGGVLSIKYQKAPEKRVEVCPTNIPQHLSNKLCNKLNCRDFDPKKKVYKQTKMEQSLDCSSSSKDMRYCVLKDTCETPTSFFCEGYLEPPPASPPAEPTNPVPIIVGVLIVLILVALIVTFVRYCIKRRNRKSMMPPADMEEADWDSGEYEDVDKSDEMGSFNRGRFRSDSDVERRRDVESNRSYNYDDVDEMTEAQPLTPQGSLVRAAKDQDLQHGVDKPSDDGVTYEVEDSQENYDDIDASPENAKTTAELHDGPKPAPDGDEEGPKDQKDEEYPVPGQDG